MLKVAGVSEPQLNPYQEQALRAFPLGLPSLVQPLKRALGEQAPAAGQLAIA
jgi:hypothetical protein